MVGLREGLERVRVCIRGGLPRDEKEEKVSGMMRRGAAYFSVCHA